MRPNLTGHFPNPNKPEQRRGKILFINADAEFHSGRAQNYLLPEHIEKIASTFERYEDVPNYALRVSLETIQDPVNDFNLNIRRYVDNSPPPEPHDVRAHLIGGVPKVEIESHWPLFDALAFDPANAFTPRPNDYTYHDFAATLPDRAAIRRVVEEDAGVQARMQTVRDALTQWWAAHAARLADLPARRNLNAVRNEFLESFKEALLRLCVLDRFKLAGVVATWWTETLADFKTLLENGFPGVIEGWIDAIADAVEDEDSVGPAFDPFTHKLVLRTMADYLQQINDAKAEIAQLKGEKEAFEQSNPPDDADEEELESWNYAKDLERQIRDLKSENKEALKKLTKLEKAASKPGVRDDVTNEYTQAKAALQPVLDQHAALEGQLEPYEKIKTDLAAARARYRTLTNEFVNELKLRCTGMDDERKQSLVLDLFAEDVQAGLDAAVVQKRQVLVQFIESLWDKYAVPLGHLSDQREQTTGSLQTTLREIGYAS